MSITRKYTDLRDLTENISYHTNEADYYLQQHQIALEEANSCWKKYLEHTRYKEEMSIEYCEVLYA